MEYVQFFLPYTHVSIQRTHSINRLACAATNMYCTLCSVYKRMETMMIDRIVANVHHRHTNDEKGTNE